jgi:predicted negative regulator of RcsB-dependent stress response
VFVVDLFGVKVGLGSFLIDSEVARLRNDQDMQLVAILDPILADLQHALDSVDNAFDALRDEAPDRWQHQVDLAERHCARAITTLESIVSTLYAE